LGLKNLVCKVMHQILNDKVKIISTAKLWIIHIERNRCCRNTEFDLRYGGLIMSRSCNTLFTIDGIS